MNQREAELALQAIEEAASRHSWTRAEYRLYISSEEWQARRGSFLKVWNFCNRCDLPRWLAIIAYDQDLNVHHRHYRTIGSERPEDLEALCKRCHEVHTFGRSALRAITPEVCPSCQGPNYDRYAEFCVRCIAVADFCRAQAFSPPAPASSSNLGEKGE